MKTIYAIQVDWKKQNEHTSKISQVAYESEDDAVAFIEGRCDDTSAYGWIGYHTDKDGAETTYRIQPLNVMEAQ